MQARATQSVDSRLAQAHGFDATEAHALFLTGMARLAAKVHQSFALERDGCTAAWRRYSNDSGSMEGSIEAFTGPELDWVVQSWLGSPSAGFTNHHLTIWMPPHSRVPHLGMAIGTIPEIFFYVDYIPRTDLWLDLAALDRYQAPLGEQYLAFHSDPRFRPFVTRECYIRQAVGPSGIVGCADVNEQNIADLFGYLDQAIDRWIEWARAGDPVPESEHAAQAARDRKVRRTIIDRDPANVLAIRALGQTVTDQLLDIMSADARHTPAYGDPR